LISGPVVSVDLNTAPRRSLYWAVLPSFAGPRICRCRHTCPAAPASCACLARDSGRHASNRVGVQSALPTPEQELEGRMDLPKTASAVVIGGGVVGCSIAYHLARRGLADVVVVESARRSAREPRARRRVASASSFPRRPRSASRWKRSACSSASRTSSARPRLQEDRLSLPPLRRQAAPRIRKAHRAAAKARADVRVITPDECSEARARSPGGRPHRRGVGTRRRARRSGEVTNGFARRARELGVKIVEGVRVSAIERAQGRASGVMTSAGAIASPLVINAAGPSAARVARLAGVELPVHPRRRHIFFTEPFPAIPGPVPLTTDVTSGFYFRKELEQVLLRPGGRRGHRRGLRRADGLGQGGGGGAEGVQRLPILGDARIAGGWAGLRPLTPDDHAIIGWAPGVEASSWPSDSAATASSTRPPPAATWPNGCSTASRRSTLAVRSEPVRPSGGRPRSDRRRRVTREDRRRPRDPRRHPRQAPAQDVLHDARSGEFRLRARRDGGRAHGWGEAACLGGPTWSEESSESVAVTIERYIAPWLAGRDATGSRR